MTFEEFFTKKKIDLMLLKRAKPDLYEEFRDHYIQMGEKSFDHTKKYWFNRLRKDFLLEVTEAPKPVDRRVAVQNAESSLPAGTEEKPAGFKPRFKPAMVKTASPGRADPTQERDDRPVATSAGKTEPLPSDMEGQPDEQRSESTSQTKPIGFKPRFKAGTTAVTPNPKTTPEKDDKEDTLSEAPGTPGPKPLGFKPRFKPGKTSNKKDDTNL